MNYFNKYLVVIIFLAIGVVSCDSSPSLQKYYVDAHDNANFIAVDIPSSILKLKNEDVSDEVKNTLESIKKVNFIGFPLDEKNNAEYTSEKQKVAAILKNAKYQELIRIGSGSKSMSVVFTGEEDAIDEVVFFGSDNDLGFALVRVLGDNMDPSKMLALLSEIKVDEDSGSLDQIKSFVKNLK